MEDKDDFITLLNRPQAPVPTSPGIAQAPVQTGTRGDTAWRQACQQLREDLELKLPKFCPWHVAWSLNIPPAKFHASGKSCQKQILSSMASGIFRKQVSSMLQAKIVRKQILSTFLPAAWASFRKQAKLFWGSLQWILLFLVFWLLLKLKWIIFDFYSIT